MLERATFVVRTLLDEFIVRVARLPRVLGTKERDLADRVFGSMRFKLEGHDPATIETSQKMVAALSGEAASVPPVLGASMIDANFTRAMISELKWAFSDGRLSVELVVRQPLSNLRPSERPELAPRPPPRRESALHSFEVRFADEVGQAIPNLEVQLNAGDRNEVVRTNAAGVALLEEVNASSGTVMVLDAAALEKILDPRWARARVGAEPRGLNTTKRQFLGLALDAVDIKAGVPNTVVIKPKLGTLFVELWDKSGRVRHANRAYTIDGPMQFSGTTDQDGRLFHDQAFPGDYTLTLTVEFFEGEDQVTDTYETALVVQSP